VFIFLSGEAHFAGMNFEEFCQRIRHKTGVTADFLDTHQNVLALAIRLKAEIFHHHKIFRIGFENAAARRFAV